MDLPKMLDYNWFKDQMETEDLELLESNFKQSKRTRAALALWADHEIDKLDKETTLSKLKEIPDRDEVLLMAAAQRDVLLKLKKLLLED